MNNGIAPCKMSVLVNAIYLLPVYSKNSVLPMYAILKNIHESVTITSLEMYLQPFLEGYFFQKKGELRAIVIIQLNDKSGGSVERHALIRASSEEVRKRLIKGLNKQVYWDDQGQRQRVRASEYVVRQIMNERRVNGLKGVMVERDHRKSERRRLGLKVVHIAEKHFGDSCSRLEH